MASVVMRFPNERLASFTCSFGGAEVSHYTLIEAKGMLTAEPAYEYSTALKHRIVIGRKTKTKTFRKRDQFAAELIYFSIAFCKTKSRSRPVWKDWRTLGRL